MFSRRWSLWCISVAAALLLAAPGAYAQSASDTLGGAPSIGALPFSATTDVSGASSSADEPSACVPSQTRSVWYQYTATADASLQADTLRSDFDTVLTVWDGLPSSGLPPVGCNDDTSGMLQSQVTFPATAGHTYYFQIARYADATPVGTTLNFNLRAPPPPPPPPPPPANDGLVGAATVNAIPYSLAEDVSGATPEASDPPSTCAYYGGAGTVWFTYTPTHNEGVLIDTNGSTVPTVVTAFAGAPGTLAQVSCGYYGSQRIDLVGGQTYYFMVSLPMMPPGTPANLVFNVNPLPPPPANDDIAAATSVPSIPYTTTEDTRGATHAATDPTCIYGESNSVWFRITPTRNMAILADTQGSDYPASISVYTGSPGSLTQTACFFPYYYDPQRISLLAGQTYYIMIAALPARPGSVEGGRLVLNLNPALDVGVTITAGLASLSTGAVQVSGTLTCTMPALVYVSGTMRQRSGRGYITGNFTVQNGYVPCGTAPSTWAATFTSDTTGTGRDPIGRFAGGSADVSVFANAFTTGYPYQRAFSQATATISLRGTSPKSLALPPPPPPRP